MNTIRDLYEIDLRLEQCVDPETGELLDAEAFEALYSERALLIDDLACWYKNIAAKAKAIKEEIDALTKRSRAMTKRAEELKQLLVFFLDGQKFESARNVVSFRRSEAVRVEDERLLREWAESSGFGGVLRYKEPEIDKGAIKELLKRGESVPGAALETRKNVVIK